MAITSYSGHRLPHNLMTKMYQPVDVSDIINTAEFGPLADSAKNHNSNFNNNHQASTNKHDPIITLKKHLEAAKTPLNKVKAVKDALEDAHNDPQLTKKIIGAALEETRGADRAEIMGTMMKDHSAIVLQMPKDVFDLSNSDLTGVTRSSLQALPYNHFKHDGLKGANFPPDLDLRGNKYMGGHGVNLDGVSMAHVSLPANANIISAKGAHVEQLVANEMTFQLAIHGGITGFNAMPNNTTRPSGRVIDSQIAASDGQKIMSTGHLAKNNKTTLPWAGDLSVSTAPAPPA